MDAQHNLGMRHRILRRNIVSPGGFHGKLVCLRNLLVITVALGHFLPDQFAEPGVINVIDMDFCPQFTSNLQFNIPDQSILSWKTPGNYSAGKGIGKAENLQLLRSMAAASTGRPRGSRVVCDNGWLEYSAQVGLTGKKVAPLLYVACGISGSPQHIVGMKDSKTVVAINRDPEAVIFRYSDICVVEDLEKFIPAFIQEAEKRREEI